MDDTVKRYVDQYGVTWQTRDAVLHPRLTRWSHSVQFNTSALNAADQRFIASVFNYVQLRGLYSIRCRATSILWCGIPITSTLLSVMM